MALVKVKTKYQVTLPTVIREKAGVNVGDVLEVNVERGKITLTPKALLDRRLAESLADFRAGRYHGPFDSAAEMVASLNSQKRKTTKKSSHSRK